MNEIRVRCKSLCELVKSKHPNFEVYDTSKLNLDQLIDMIDGAVWYYIFNNDEGVKPTDKICVCYSHLLKMIEHYKQKPKGWVF